jgi:hypothetical protein
MSIGTTTDGYHKLQECCEIQWIHGLRSLGWYSSRWSPPADLCKLRVPESLPGGVEFADTDDMKFATGSFFCLMFLLVNHIFENIRELYEHFTDFFGTFAKERLDP